MDDNRIPIWALGLALVIGAFLGDIIALAVYVGAAIAHMH